MNPRNSYTPGLALDPALHAIGRPVTMFLPGAPLIEAGTIARVVADRGELFYDVRVVSGGTYRSVKLGNLNNPQPNTFTYAP